MQRHHHAFVYWGPRSIPDAIATTFSIERSTVVRDEYGLNWAELYVHPKQRRSAVAAAVVSWNSSCRAAEDRILITRLVNGFGDQCSLHESGTLDACVRRYTKRIACRSKGYAAGNTEADTTIQDFIAAHCAAE